MIYKDTPAGFTMITRNSDKAQNRLSHLYKILNDQNCRNKTFVYGYDTVIHETNHGRSPSKKQVVHDHEVMQCFLANKAIRIY